MKIIQWTDDLATGIDKIDEQHQELCHLLNELYDAMAQGHSETVIDHTLVSLLNYGKKHFATEETYFNRYLYPDRVEHKKEHDQFLVTAAELYKNHQSGQKKVSIETLHFLRDWITHHIKESDMSYKDFLKNKMD